MSYDHNSFTIKKKVKHAHMYLGQSREDFVLILN